MNIIDVKNITKHYSLGTQTVEALRGISFGIEQGEFIAIMSLRIWKIHINEYYWVS